MISHLFSVEKKMHLFPGHLVTLRLIIFWSLGLLDLFIMVPFGYKKIEKGDFHIAFVTHVCRTCSERSVHASYVSIGGHSPDRGPEGVLADCAIPYRSIG